jgi:hypothetical protein
MKLIEGGRCCVICGNYQPDADIATMEKPSMPTIKKPIDHDLCMSTITENMPRIKDLRSRGVSYRAIADRLGLSMNHTTLQKHYSRITAGLPQLKRGRKPEIREVTA